MMENNQKAVIYDQCLRESDDLQRKISRIKSEYVGNIPPDKMNEIQMMEGRISLLVKRLESLF